MEVIVAALRQKPPAVSRGAKSVPSLYDILLLDVPLTVGTGRSGGKKYLPRSTISHEEEPSEYVLQHLYHITGSENGGLKGLRALYVSPGYGKTESRESYTKGSLFCVPIDYREKLNPSFADSNPTSPRFYSLETIIEALNNGTMTFSNQTVFMLSRLERWIKEKHEISGSPEALFTKPSAQRIKKSVFNPAFVNSMIYSRSTDTLDLVGMQGANEALAHMMAIEKCDKVVMNPLFGSGLPYKHSVDAIAVNQFWGRGAPDLSKLNVPKQDGSSGSYSDSSLQEEYKVFKFAWEGNADGIKDLLKQGVSANQRDQNSWAPIHYAAWYGHLKAIQVLLTEGNGNPNIPNKKRSTPLHFASLSGQPYVVELLLSHPDIDVLAVDREGRTALDTCVNKESDNHKACSNLLKKAADKPCQMVDVFLMNGACKKLKLVSGPNTSVHQLHIQMIRELQLPEECCNMFTIWICSKNLQLQLKKEHRPVEHMHNWKKILQSLTDCNAGKEEARLEWRRDARLTIHHEKLTQNPMTIALLYHEAYHHYIKSLYPCSDDDAVILGSILMQLNHGNFDARKAKNVLSTRKHLAEVVPPSKLEAKNTNWSNKIQTKYRQLNEQLPGKERGKPVLQYQFLLVCWNLVVYGSAFFTGSATVKSGKAIAVQIGVNDVGIHVIQNLNRTVLQTFHYKDIDWVFNEQQCSLEINPKGSKKTSILIKTKQAGLIEHLMTKMKNSYSANNTAPQSSGF